MTLLATRGFVVQTECGVHVIACASITLRRVCRSTVTAETFHMELGVEGGGCVHTLICKQ